MPRDLMTSCEQRKQFKKPDGGYVWRWREIPASEAHGVQPQNLRCIHCRGVVRVHHPKNAGTEGVPKDLIEHKSKLDSVCCKGGINFDGNHRMSDKPVV